MAICAIRQEISRTDRTNDINMMSDIFLMTEGNAMEQSILTSF